MYKGFLRNLKILPGEDLILLNRYKMEYKNQGYGLPENKFLALNANWMKRLTEAMRDYRNVNSCISF